MKKIWKIMILCMILCFFCAGCSNDDEMISEDRPKPTTEKRTEIIKQKTTQTKNEATADQEEQDQQEKRIKIAIDAGHQGKGNSKTEPIGPGAKMRKPKVAYGTQGVKTKVPESKLTLQIALKLEKELKKRGYDVYMIRRKQNVNISNKQRAIRANKSGADICIRLHADAASANVRGVSVLYPSQQNHYVAKLSKKSKKLSKNILDSYCKSTRFKKRGLSKRDDLTGTNWSKIPVALIEMGFMTNKTEDKQMQKKQTQKKMVDGIANGIDQYFK